VLAGATADGRLLLTLDRGLGDIRAYPPGTYAWIVVVRLDHQSPRAIRDAMERVSATVDFADLRGCVRCGVRMNFASVGPNRDHPSSVENYARLGRSPREPVVTAMFPEVENRPGFKVVTSHLGDVGRTIPELKCTGRRATSLRLVHAPGVDRLPLLLACSGFPRTRSGARHGEPR
jgi:hypothetical protein